MAGFRFRLEVVQRVRKQAMDARRRDVALAIRSIRDVDSMIDETNEQLRQAVDSQRDSRRLGRIDTQSLAQQQLHRVYLDRRLAELHVERQRREAVLEQERSKLSEATKSLRVIEKLRERQWTRFQENVRRREQAVSDEMAVQRYLRISREASSTASVVHG